MPKADDMVYFKNYHKGLAAPFKYRVSQKKVYKVNQE